MTWQPLGLAGSAVAPLTIDPSNPYILYAGTIYPDSGVYKSTDSGNNWFQTGLDSGSVWSLAIDPLSSNILYAGLREGKLHKSTNGGDDWTQIDPGWTNTDVLSLAIDPVNTNVLYAGTSGAEKETAATGGIYQSTDGGNSWTDISSGLTTTHALCLAIHPAAPDTIYTGTYGGGVYTFSDVGIEEDEASHNFPQNADLIQIYPNPFSKLTTISFGIEQGAKGIELKIYDVSGRLIRDFPVDLCNQNKSVKSVCWDGRDDKGRVLPSGVYFVQLKTGDEFSHIKKLLLIK